MNDIGNDLHPVDINTAEQKISIDEIINEIRKLPDTEMKVFNMIIFDGLTHKDVSKKLNIPEGTSRWHLANARTFLKKRLSTLLFSIKMLVL
jgi:RNA polymerase sigma-70 factor (ECF subfamily)